MSKIITKHLRSRHKKYVATFPELQQRFQADTEAELTKLIKDAEIPKQSTKVQAARDKANR